METARLRKATLFSCSLSCFVAWLDFAIVNTALPAIADELDATFLDLQWIMNAFILGQVIFIIFFGKFADQFGRRRVNLFGSSLFFAASLGAGLASDPVMLIISRFVQGIATAAIIPSALAMIAHAYEGHEKGRAIAIWSGIVSIGLAIGPAVGGFLVSALSWRWVFWINLPIILVSLFLTCFYCRESKHNIVGCRIDFRGLWLLLISVVSINIGFMFGPEWSWTDGRTIGFLAVGFYSLYQFIQWQFICPHPFLPMEFFSRKAFLAPVLVMINLVFVFTTALFLIPLYLIQIRHQAPYVAGGLILLITACLTLGSFFVGRLMHRVSHKKLILAGLFLYFASLIVQAFFTETTSLGFILLAFVLLGTGWGLARPPATTGAIAAAPLAHGGMASGVLWFVQNTAGTLGLSILLSLFRASYSAHQTPAAFMTCYRATMWILALVSGLLWILTAWWLKPVEHK